MNNSVENDDPVETVIDVRVLLECKERAYLERRISIDAIEAFMIAREAGLPPPKWVLEWLHEGFTTYHAAQGRKSLDEAFGLKIGSGQRNLWRRLRQTEWEQNLMVMIWRLNLLFGISIAKAAEMVERFQQTSDWNKTGWKLKSYAASTLEDKYYRKWSQIFKDTSEEIKQDLINLPHSEKLKYLEHYPLDCIPPDLK